MKKIILISTLFLSTLFSWEWSDLWSESIREEIIARHTNGEKKLLVKYQGEGSQEVIIQRIEYNKAGQIIKEEDLIDNTLKTIEYHPNGSIARLQNFKNEKTHGDNITYHDNGQIKYSLQYTDGKLNENAYAIYKSNGESLSDSLIVGFSKTFCDNGQLRESKNVIGVEHKAYSWDDGSINYYFTELIDGNHFLYTDDCSEQIISLTYKDGLPFDGYKYSGYEVFLADSTTPYFRYDYEFGVEDFSIIRTSITDHEAPLKIYYTIPKIKGLSYGDAIVQISGTALKISDTTMVFNDLYPNNTVFDHNHIEGSTFDKSTNKINLFISMDTPKEVELWGRRYSTKKKSLYLKDRDLNGHIPSDIGYLVNLENLDLRYNNLSGRIPQELCDLIDDNSLSLSHIMDGNNLLNTCFSKIYIDKIWYSDASKSYKAHLINHNYDIKYNLTIGDTISGFKIIDIKLDCITIEYLNSEKTICIEDQEEG